jgi:3-keto-disaccharide hydrolase
MQLACICPVFASLLTTGAAAETGWQKLFNGKNLDGWHVVIGNPPRADTNQWIQIHDGMIHMYKDAVQGSPQPAGYIVTSNEYSNYHLKLEYKWGEKRFGDRSNARRDAGILYHVIGKDGVWPKSVECQIQEKDVGDVFTVYTRLTTEADPATINPISEVITNKAGVVRTNTAVRPIFKPLDQGGVTFVQGVGDSIRRVVRNPMAERDGWNIVEVIVHGDEATYVVNGKVNNRVHHIQERVNGEWVPLKKGRIALQLEFAEVFYRNVEIKEEPEKAD